MTQEKTTEDKVEGECFVCGHKEREHPIRNLAGWIICPRFIKSKSSKEGK